MGTLELQKLIISIHAPAKGATRLRSDKQQSQQYFNPRSREGSDRLHSREREAVFSISIHAPAKGATGEQAKKEITVEISIHAPAKGATRLPFLVLHYMMNFNPRSREGSDITRRPILVYS